VSITLPTKETNSLLKIGQSEYKVRSEDEELHSIIRPLISNENTAIIGHQISASFSLSRHISVAPSDETPPVSICLFSTVSLAQISFYSRIPQVEGLRVRHMPFGSATDLKDLQARTHKRGNVEVGRSQEKSKRRKSELKESSVIDLETPSKHKEKKPKKSKKEVA
jgi:hypothetical protein